MLTGELIGGALLVSPDGTGKPVVETEPPDAPEGRLARMLARDLTDEQAVAVKALYDEWQVGAEYDKAARVLDAGDLYRCTKKHMALAEWRPSTDGEHWVKLG